MAKLKEQGWYARLHRTPQKNNTTCKKRLNLSIFFRLWLTMALIVIVAGVVVFQQLFNYIEPTSKQVIEDTLADTAKILAVNLAQPLATGELLNENYQKQLDKAFASDKKNNPLAINIDNNEHNHSGFRVYITDNKGIVIYDSALINNTKGQDYSRWNDVYLTLKGEYGARSSRSNEENSIMYVAQPIVNAQGNIIGVVSVGKSEATILPYLKIAHEHMKETLLLVVLLAVFCVALVAWWLQQSIALVIRYTGELASITAKPSFYLGRELNELTDAIEDMKHRLENKSYVTDYVHTLTHELKSPLTAIKASGELLADVNLDDEDRQTLSDTINEQSEKLQLLIDRLLLLAKIEQPNFKLASKPINIVNLLNNLLLNQQARITKNNLSIQFLHQNNICEIAELIKIGNKNLIMADEFWLTQALNNILDNAIVFAKENIYITVDSNANGISLQIINDGNLVPEYALDKVFNRYFSLNKKGTGLGLTLAKQVIEHHGGDISIKNGQFLANSVVVVAIKI